MTVSARKDMRTVTCFAIRTGNPTEAGHRTDPPEDPDGRGAPGPAKVTPPIRRLVESRHQTLSRDAETTLHRALCAPSQDDSWIVGSAKPGNSAHRGVPPPLKAGPAGRGGSRGEPALPPKTPVRSIAGVNSETPLIEAFRQLSRRSVLLQPHRTRRRRTSSALPDTARRANHHGPRPVQPQPERRRPWRLPKPSDASSPSPPRSGYSGSITAEC